MPDLTDNEQARPGRDGGLLPPGPYLNAAAASMLALALLMRPYGRGIVPIDAAAVAAAFLVAAFWTVATITAAVIWRGPVARGLLEAAVRAVGYALVASYASELMHTTVLVVLVVPVALADYAFDGMLLVALPDVARRLGIGRSA